MFFKEIFEQLTSWVDRNVKEVLPPGLVAHMHKEADEILAEPTKGEEYIDQVILSIHGYYKFAGGSSTTFLRDLKMKADKLERRTYKVTDPNAACEHDRSTD